MKIFEVTINGEKFQVKGKEIFTASKRAIEIYHTKRKEQSRRTRIPKHIELFVSVKHDIL